MGRSAASARLAWLWHATLRLPCATSAAAAGSRARHKWRRRLMATSVAALVTAPSWMHLQGELMQIVLFNQTLTNLTDL